MGGQWGGIFARAYLTLRLLATPRRSNTEWPTKLVFASVYNQCANCSSSILPHSMPHGGLADVSASPISNRYEGSSCQTGELISSGSGSRSRAAQWNPQGLPEWLQVEWLQVWSAMVLECRQTVRTWPCSRVAQSCRSLAVERGSGFRLSLSLSRVAHESDLEAGGRF